MRIEDLTLDYLKKNHKLIHSFGLGFIQIKLNNTERLHVYCPEVQITTGEEDIHDHRYDFKSKILKGSIANHIYKIRSGEGFLLTQENCSPNKELKVNPPKEVDIEKVSSTIYIAGDDYQMHKDTLHRVEAPRCITFVTRGEVTKDLANVVYKKGQEVVCPFSVKLDQKVLWEIVAKELSDVY